MTFQFLDPREKSTASKSSMTDRPGDLSGIKLALLDNSKSNSKLILESIARELKNWNPGLSFEYFCKDDSSRPVKDKLLDRIVRQYNAAITGVGD